MTLVIMAAGMGSRYGGLKQIDPVGPNGEFIIDYSIYDAIKAGFNKVVFIIKEENYEIFKETIGKRIEKQIEVQYVFQKIPYELGIPSDRVKPLGTAHAIYCCKDVIKENFAVVNADDFYGADAFKKLYDNLQKMNTNEACMVCYKVINTLSENGSVKRGVCFLENNNLQKIVESSVTNENNKTIVSPLDGSKSFEVSDDTLVSMNVLGFSPKIFEYMNDEFNIFLEKNKKDLLTCEWFLPDVIFKLMKDNKIGVKILKTDAKWYGVTYKEDKETVINAIKMMISDGIYPENLWEK